MLLKANIEDDPSVVVFFFSPSHAEKRSVDLKEKVGLQTVYGCKLLLMSAAKANIFDMHIL